MAKSDAHYFYVLQCKDGSYYGGYTTDVARREAEHNAGIRCKYTRNRRPVHVIHSECFATRSEATKAEAAFKKLPRTKKDSYLQENKE
ncbi:GIY-YIG nuclease family protein [Listeria booriae]|uniref:GIY-YIG nuclease family protein n=1 Tax=Listeria booriae TaxID=1552123 RepID=UPI00162AEEA6|nr:GIY-YIG nuclease family protein [Listeria booriae]MBC1358818.1 GIY-YIG nuclease family protein [Listeria booriae]MBC1890664.1 GIY-YIG nuclease family protein [Listeria booriae]MBC1976201.1 GIY-YIG nuclease family protein [Listeria booriae]MBC2033240.1 GIY-YIG nuclease family protein [Listeria booriae]MBC2047933.1 GIY-YIG nuclease family protein [Listeria booriae]